MHFKSGALIISYKIEDDKDGKFDDIILYNGRCVEAFIARIAVLAVTYETRSKYHQYPRYLIMPIGVDQPKRFLKCDHFLVSSPVYLSPCKTLRRNIEMPKSEA